MRLAFRATRFLVFVGLLLAAVGYAWVDRYDEATFCLLVLVLAELMEIRGRVV